MSLFDRELIQKYDRPGPRYTSYPTAPKMSEEFSSIDPKQVLGDSNRGERPISLYVHQPFCRSMCLFCACNTFTTNRRDRVADYLTDLLSEVDLLAAGIDSNRRVVQLHWGGGTPSYLTPEEITKLGGRLASVFQLEQDLEASVELDPREVDRERLEALREVGFNRASLGVQDFDTRVQKTINRVQSFEQTRQVIDWCRELGFQSINVDLMYGLPYQTQESYRKTLDAVLELDVDRYAIFNYAHVPWLKPHQAAFDEGTLPNGEEKLSIVELVANRLIDSGYQFIGMDHFARADDELSVAVAERSLWRNFQGYTTRAGTDLFGLGVTAISLLKDVYYQNERTLNEYHGRLSAGQLPIMRGLTLTADDRLRRHVIMDLMCHFELDFSAVEERYGLNFWEHFDTAREQIRQFEQDELVRVGDGRLVVTERGRFLIRNIAMVFDAYLPRESSVRYSRTV